MKSNIKKQTLARRFLLPVLLVLVLLPPLSCFVFFQTAQSYACLQASEEMDALLKEVLPLMHEAYSDDNSDTASFLLRIGTLERQRGNTRLMIFGNDLQLIYPRDEETRGEIVSLSAEFVAAISDGTLQALHTPEKWNAQDGSEYLVGLYDIPSTAIPRYLLAYCPSAEIGTWVNDASLIVLGVSFLFLLTAVIVLLISARGVSKQVKRLNAETKQIGAGHYGKIDAEFSVRELDALRLAVNEMSQKLADAEKAQKMFFYNISHDLRSPLMSIGGYAQGIENDIFEDPKYAAKIICDESRRLTNEVNELLVLSRLDAVGFPVLERISVNELIESAIERAGGLLMQCDKTIARTTIGEEIRALGNEEADGKILDNLLSNAIRHARKRIEITVSEENDRVCIHISDDGAGIDERDLPHIFERGYKGNGGQYGLGLAIAQTAAIKTEGILQAENIPRGGACFTLKMKKYSDHSYGKADERHA